MKLRVKKSNITAIIFSIKEIEIGEEKIDMIISSLENIFQSRQYFQYYYLINILQNKIKSFKKSI